MGVGGVDRDVWAGDLWDEIAAQWRRRDDGALRELLITLGGERGPDVAAAIAVLHDESMSVAGATEALDAAVATLLDVDAPAGAALTYLECLVMWERSDELRQITAVARALGGAVEARGVVDDRTDGALLRATVLLVDALHHQLFVENAVFCSCPVALEEDSDAVLAALDGAGEALAGCRQGIGLQRRALHELLSSDVEVLCTYYGAMKHVAAAAGAWIDSRVSSAAELEVAIGELRRAEERLAPDVFESELRSHRLSLEAMLANVGASSLWLDRGRVVYLYPFALPDEVPDRLVAEVYGGRRRPGDLGGAPVQWVDRAIVAGSWQQDDLLGVRNEVLTLALAPLTLTTTAHEVLPELRPEIRLASTGNHLVRIEVDVEDLDTHELDQYVRRVGSEIGREEIRLREGLDDGTGRRWPMLCDYAVSVVAELQAHLRDHPPDGAAGDVDPTVRVDASEDVLAGAHVLVSARRLSVETPHGERRMCGTEELVDHLGAAILLQPSREQPSSLESWVRRQVTAVPNVLAGRGRDDEMLVRTHGATLVYLPGAAEWQVENRDEMAEFTVSLVGMLHSWSSYLGGQARAADDDLVAVRAGADVELVRSRLRTLARDFSRVHGMLTQLRSANVCRQAGDRELLDDLRKVAGIDVLERALHEAIAIVVAQQARLTEEAERLRADRERRVAERQARVQLVLEAGVTVLAFTALIDLVNGAYGVSGAVVPMLECVGLVVFTVLLVLWLRRQEREPGARRGVLRQDGDRQL